MSYKELAAKMCVRRTNVTLPTEATAHMCVCDFQHTKIYEYRGGQNSMRIYEFH